MGEPDPNWLREAWRGVAHEWSSYARTAVGVTLHPRRFVGEWAQGEGKALNPLACMLNALALLAAFTGAWRAAFHRANPLPDWVELVEPAQLALNTALLASLLHFPFKWLGGVARWRSSFAAPLFVAAGPMLPLYIARDLTMDRLAALAPRQGLLLLAPPVLYYLSYVTLALAGAHRIRLWRAAVAMTCGVLVVSGMILFVVRFLPRH